MTGLWVFAVFVLLAAIGVYLSWTAGRIDRLHYRVEGARAALDAALYRRSAIALEVATSGMLDPATSLLIADAARRARAAPPEEREVAESDFTKALAAVFGEFDDVREIASQPEARELLDELGAVSRRVEMARRFHNDTVASTRALRNRRRVRWFRLAGNAPVPATIEMDDAPPKGLAL